MPQNYRTRDFETVDEICYRLYGQTRDLTEAVLSLNPHLADYGALLPENLIIQLPPPPTQSPILPTIQLWE